ncbi:hypothetical protein IJK16_00580 [Candidatus Saccharibacteria bacterium]|nr:hypothetical protein [Candidatus Saccharibacteria bacterium]
MDSISKKDKLDFLISVSKGRLFPGTDWDTAYKYYYDKKNCHGLYSSAINVAYETLKRRLTGIGHFPKKVELLSEANECLEQRLKTINADTQDNFDKWHLETVVKLKQIFANYNFNFTVGLAQKWINMSLKHLAIAGDENVKKVYPFCHIPVDSYIIDGIRKKLFPDEFLDLNYAFDQTLKDVKWSKIDDYDAYLDFQKSFRKKCHVPPLDKEFQFWLAAKEAKNGGSR